MGNFIRKSLVLLIVLIIAFSLVACKKPEKEVVEEPDRVKKVEELEEVVLSQEEQDEKMKAYYQLITERKGKDEIVDFIDDNIDRLDGEKKQTMIVALEEYLSATDSSIKEDYALLSKYKNHVSSEMASYLNVLEKETENSFTDGEVLNVSLEEILDRALLAEDYLDQYPTGDKFTSISELYNEYIKASILGSGNQYIYAEEGTSMIKDEYLEKYRSFVDKHKESRTSKILKQYIDLLESNDKDMNNESVVRFYDDLDMVVGEQF